MGLCIESEGSKMELTGGYGMLMRIRIQIAKVWDEEFGKHYETLPTIWGDENFKEFDKKTNEILSDDRFKNEDADLVKFLFASDCDGECGYETAKKIYDLIKDVKYEGKLRYLTYPSTNENDWEDFKQLLLDCWNNKKSFTWC